MDTTKPRDTKAAYQKGKWEFDANVTDCFDDMLERSIPQYELMRDLCFRMGRNFLRPNSTMIDLGCSRGGALAHFIAEARKMEEDGRCNFIGVEVSEPMVAAAIDRFKEVGNVKIEHRDLRQDYPLSWGNDFAVSLTTAVLTLQFIPIEHRHRIMRSIYKSTATGGAFILVEKVLGNTHRIDETLIKEYYSIKSQNGYTQDQIERKRLSLEGVLVPITARWNEDLLLQSGFTEVDCFWRSLNFAAWIAIKR